MIKYTAQYNCAGAYDKVKSIFYSGLIFELLLGSILSVTSFLLSGFLASTFSRPEITSLIQIASFSVLTHALISLATAIFTGMERRYLNSFMLTIQALVKTGLIIVFVVLGSWKHGCSWRFYAWHFGGRNNWFEFAWIMLRSPREVNSKLEIFGTVKYLLRYGFPLSIGSFICVLDSILYICYGYLCDRERSYRQLFCCVKFCSLDYLFCYACIYHVISCFFKN